MKKHEYFTKDFWKFGNSELLDELTNSVVSVENCLIDLPDAAFKAQVQNSENERIYDSLNDRPFRQFNCNHQSATANDNVLLDQKRSPFLQAQREAA